MPSSEKVADGVLSRFIIREQDRHSPQMCNVYGVNCIRLRKVRASVLDDGGQTRASAATDGLVELVIEWLKPRGQLSLRRAS